MLWQSVANFFLQTSTWIAFLDSSKKSNGGLFKEVVYLLLGPVRKKTAH
jgi:hypothetical protein